MIFFVKKPINEQNHYQNTLTVEYKIQKGDTLWGISHKFTNKNLINTFFILIFGSLDKYSKVINASI